MEAQTVDTTKALSITGAPRIGNGIVFIGQAGAEYLQRGYLSGWDAETGRKLWHWWTIPGNPADGFADQPEMEWAAKTWKGEWWKSGGGGTPWDGIVYDPQTDLVIFGTGNGSPWPAGLRSPGGGDNLFVASIVALHAKTGKYAWHYQATPMDSFDYDNTSPFTLADLVIGGQKKHVVMQAPKNGFIYVIEAATGKVLSADLTVPGANWLTGFDEKNNWKPIINPDADPGRTGKSWTVVPSAVAPVVSAGLQSAGAGLHVPADALQQLHRGAGAGPDEEQAGHRRCVGRAAGLRGAQPRHRSARLPARLGSGPAQGRMASPPKAPAATAC